MSAGQWLPLVGLTLSAFIFNTSEFMPIGLLTDIAVDLHVTEARAGMLISVYAWVVALLSLPLMLLVARMEYRRLLLVTLALFIVSHLLSAVAGSYAVLMASRIGVACSHAVFWSIASPLAVRIVPEKRRSLALSMIVTGTSVAMVVGMPLGRIIGLYVGWRTSFLCVAVLAAVVFCYLLAVFPKVPGGKSFSVRRLPVLLKHPVLVGIYLMALLVPTAHYTVYSYIEPFLRTSCRMDYLDTDRIRCGRDFRQHALCPLLRPTACPVRRGCGGRYRSAVAPAAVRCIRPLRRHGTLHRLGDCRDGLQRGFSG